MSLPNITLKISEDSRGFLERMESLLREEGGLVVKSHLEEQSEFESLSLGFSAGAVESREPVGIFLARQGEEPRIRIEVLGDWESIIPGYAEYVARARDLFAHRLKAYNRKFKKRYRLAIPSLESTRPRLTPSLEREFERFTCNANMRCLHYYDWMRFYRFIANSQRYQPGLDPQDIGYFLRRAGFPDELSKYLSDVFYRCREFHIEIKGRSRRT